ncbi:MAG: transcriptional regulator [Candidatus Woesearchaeota archaeon]
MKYMPQEIEVWYLLPALRKELALCFVTEHKLKQKEAASILGLTEAAVSQYLKSKRGKNITFRPAEIELIKKTARKMVNDPKKASESLVALCHQLRGSGTMCGIHKSVDCDVPENCSICKEHRK